MKKVLGSKTEWAHKDHELTRGLLINSSAGFKILVKYLKDKYKLNELSKKNIKDKLFFSGVSTGLVGLGTLNDTLISICGRLGLTRQFLEDSILGMAGINPLVRSLPFYVAVDGWPLPEGFYMRVDPQTRLETVKNTYRVIMNEWSRVFREADIDGVPPRIPKRDKPISDLKKKMEIYELIEKTILANYNYRLEGLEDTDHRAEQLVTDAINFAAEEFSLNSASVKSAYYGLLDYYQIPTFNEFRKLLI